MIRYCLILVLLTIVVGCTAHPRYRTGGEEWLPEVDQKDARYSTNEYLRLGSILQEYLGKPYKGKSDYEEGVDCSHFVRSVFIKFNRTELPRTVAEQYKAGREVVYKYLTYGDLVFFKTERNKVSHVGIYVGDNSFIHAGTSTGVVITSMREKYWSERFAGARRILK